MLTCTFFVMITYRTDGCRRVRDQHEVPGSGMARDVPVLPSGLPDMGNMLGFVSGLARDRNQIDGQALIDQKPHPTWIVASFRRVLRAGD